MSKKIDGKRRACRQDRAAGSELNMSLEALTRQRDPHPAPAPAPVTNLADMPQAMLALPGRYRGRVAYMRPYGDAALLVLRDRSAEGLQLAVWIAPHVKPSLNLVRAGRFADESSALGCDETGLAVEVEGCFHANVKAQRLSLDVVKAAQIVLR